MALLAHGQRTSLGQVGDTPREYRARREGVATHVTGRHRATQPSLPTKAMIVAR